MTGHDSAFVALRPEQVAVARTPVSGQTFVAGRLAALSYFGAATTCTVALDGGGTLVASRDDLPPDLAVGDGVACTWPPTAPVPLEA